MILYFSGTGNSLQVARKLASLLGETLCSMEDGTMPQLAEDEALGIVFPVYAWGVPSIVSAYLQDKSLGQRYIWAVMTCGDDMGYADVILERIIGRKADAAYSVQMPNTYVCLPGFDVDAPDLAERKVKETNQRLPQIAEDIRSRKKVRQLTRGTAAWMKTYVIRPLFNAFLVTDSHFRHSAECSSCALCAKQCPTRDIMMKDGHPQWQHRDCTGCLRCYHSCPKRAIDWGRYTVGKGQKRFTLSL